MNTSPRFARRDFLKTSFVALATITLVPRRVLGGPGQTPPSETLTRAVIGTGGMGLVYRGRQPIIGKPVAIKILRPASRMGRRSFLVPARLEHLAPGEEPPSVLVVPDRPSAGTFPGAFALEPERRRVDPAHRLGALGGALPGQGLPLPCHPVPGPG